MVLGPASPSICNEGNGGSEEDHREQQRQRNGGTAQQGGLDVQKIGLIPGPRFLARVASPGAELVGRSLQESVGELHRYENQTHRRGAKPRPAPPKEANEQQRVDQQAKSKGCDLGAKRPAAVVYTQHMIYVVQQSQTNRRHN